MVPEELQANIAAAEVRAALAVRTEQTATKLFLRDFMVAAAQAQAAVLLEERLVMDLIWAHPALFA